MAGADPPLTCRRIMVRGRVQGVGFRPFLFSLARRWCLAGWARNTLSGVEVVVQGPQEGVEGFMEEISEKAPPLAAVDAIEAEAVEGMPGIEGFEIRESEARGGWCGVPLDMGVCHQCLEELEDPADRRHGYPFINCTNCGPRYSIIEALPYDRPRTTMAPFAMCRACAREYGDPLDRRFHAQPVACPACGPQIRLVGRGGEELARGQGCLDEIARILASGGIVALKGIGGFHLACDAGNPEAVAELRRRKGRPAKPFAVMAADIEEVRRFCRVSPQEEQELVALRRPILLLEKREPSILEGVAPGIRRLGMMLPYTPLHHLLFRSPGCPRLLVMTSGNRSGLPLEFTDEGAMERLAPLADALLLHDRGIAARIDDPVLFWHRGPRTIRLGRGTAPLEIGLAHEVPPILAMGADLKNTIALGTGRRAVVSPHVGDLDTVEALDALRSVVERFMGLYGVRPRLVAVDLHPDYASTALGLELARELGARVVRVQHHCAHGAAALAQANAPLPALALVLDGTGLGDDSTIWGGELLLLRREGALRMAHLEQFPLPGGDAAAREPWRPAISLLLMAGLESRIPGLLAAARVAPATGAVVESMIRRRINAPLTSSCGRLFDGVASILGVCHANSYEGQAAMELQAAAESATDPPYFGPYPVQLGEEGGAATICVAPLIRSIIEDIARGLPAGAVAIRFHRWLVEAWAAAVRWAAGESGVRRVALVGGCMQNALLLGGLMDRLEAEGMEVVVPSSIPLNDGGISLGQLAVAGGGLPCA